MNINAVNTENNYALVEFIKSVVCLIRIFNTFENWKGVYTDKYFNWYFESSHPSINSNYAHSLLVDLSQFIRAYRVVNVNRLKKFVVLVEGDSEYESLPKILSALGVIGIESGVKNSVRFVNLKGKDTIQKNRIRDILTKYREEEVSYFLVLDNDANVIEYIEDLKREGLIIDEYCLIWKNKFEDNFERRIYL